jgi:hypothetical protein
VSGPSGSPNPTIDAIVVGDEPDAWRAAGFTVDADGTCHNATVRIRLVGRDGGKRIRGWSLRDTVPASLGDDTIDGLVTQSGDDPPAEPAVHPNGTRSIDHIVLATPDSARTVAALEVVGFEARGVRQTGNYGAPMRQTFFRAGEVIVELIGPGEPGPADESTGPAAFFGLAFTVDDLDATATLLAEALGTVKDAVQPGRRIATMRHKLLDVSVATAFMSPEPGAATSR